MLATLIVVILGLTAPEGEDALARELTTELRAAVAERGAVAPATMSLSETDVTSTQMMLALSCSSLDSVCMQRIATHMRADLVLYGELGGTQQSGLTLRLRLHVNQSASSAVRDALSVSPSSGFMVETRVAQPEARDREFVRRLFEQLIAEATPRSAAVPTATLTLVTGVAGAEVRMDGAVAAVTPADGRVVVTGVAPGPRHIEVIAPGYDAFSLDITLVDSESREVYALLRPRLGAAGDTGQSSRAESSRAPSTLAVIDPDPPMALRSVAGWSLVGAGTALVGATIYTWARIGAIADDNAYLVYRQAVPSSAGDVCRESGKGRTYGTSARTVARVQDLCDEADVLEILQLVFLGTAVVAFGSGGYLLFTDGGPAATSVEVNPSVTLNGAGIDALVRF